MQSIYLSLLYVLYFSVGSAFGDMSVCEDSTVVVDSISVLCDTPGSYYYGGSKYRNSETCQAGDKVHVYIQLEIIDQIEVADAFLTVEVGGYGTVDSYSVYESASFCSNVVSVDGQECPQPGSYEISQVFYFGNKNDSYEYSWKPKVSVGIKTSNSNRNFDLGGANTDHCAGNMFGDWSRGFRNSANNTIVSFLLTFGILTGSLLAMCFFCLCMCRQSRRSRVSNNNDDNDISNDYHKMSMVGKNNNLVDF